MFLFLHVKTFILVDSTQFAGFATDAKPRNVGGNFNENAEFKNNLKEMNFTENKIAIKDLNLWDENARFPDQFYNSDEKELIKYFLSKKNFKIKELVDEIVNDFDLPQLEKIVVWNTDENLVVLEGNRRLTGYKLLANPALIVDIDKKLFKHISEIKSKINIDNTFKLECLISSDKDQCYRYIDRKHSKGNNQVNWVEPERINYSNRRGIESQNAKIKIAITNYVRTLNLPIEIINEVLGQGYVTTFYRFVATGPAKETFGLSTNKDGNLTFTDKDFPEKLKVIIHNVLKKKDFDGNTVDSRELNKNPQIKQFLEKIDPENSKKVDKEIQEGKSKNLFGQESSKLSKSSSKASSSLTTRKTPKTKENNILFGKSLSLKSGKVNDLYRAILNIYEKNENDFTVLPIIGMSMRLITEVAARVYFDNTDPEKSNKDQLYNDFLKIAKKEMSLEKESKNFLSLTTDWLDGSNNLEAILAKYAHGNITTSKDGILKSSFIIGEVLEHYFKK
ncbi:hypothetical protein GCM10022386_00750 [Flavobacterium cheonhonense]|uniref:ParB/Sulfiredoxin domain-containing protein n=1 Tax=Flavobacterium cheonhonense TaxID=706185 RepID=A0ABP7T667_9FLAO